MNLFRYKNETEKYFFTTKPLNFTGHLNCGVKSAPGLISDNSVIGKDFHAKRLCLVYKIFNETTRTWTFIIHGNVSKCYSLTKLKAYRPHPRD